MVETRHTVVLGWAEQSLTIIRELASANASEGGGVVAVLSDADKQNMERELYSFIAEDELKGTKVVFRSGSRLRTADMRKVAIEAARAIIIVSDVRLDPDTADAEVLQVVLNLTTMDLAANCSVVAEIRDVDNEPLVMLVGGDLVKTVTSHDIIGRLMLLFVRQPGLARVYSSVLGFDGSEFYVERWDALVGTRWRDVAVRFLDAVPIGVQRGKDDVLINPPPGYVFQRGDGLIVLAEDNDTYACEEPADIGPRRTFRAARERSMAPEAVRFAGWRRDVAHMIRLLDRLAPPGSELHMLCTLTVAARNAQIAENGLDTSTLTNLRVMHHVGNTAVKRHMDALPLERLTSAIVLSDQGEESDMINSDSHCLATLLLIRGLQAARKSQNVSVHGGNKALPRSASSAGIDMWHEGQATATNVPIVVEILDPRTQRTVNESYKVYSVADFIQSNELISKARRARARCFRSARAHCLHCCADACHDQRGAVREDDSGQSAGRHGHAAGGGAGGGLHRAGPGRLLPGAVTRVHYHAAPSPLRLHLSAHTCVCGHRHMRVMRADAPSCAQRATNLCRSASSTRRTRWFAASGASSRWSSSPRTTGWPPPRRRARCGITRSCRRKSRAWLCKGAALRCQATHECLVTRRLLPRHAPPNMGAPGPPMFMVSLLGGGTWPNAEAGAYAVAGLSPKAAVRMRATTTSANSTPMLVSITVMPTTWAGARRGGERHAANPRVRFARRAVRRLAWRASAVRAHAPSTMARWSSWRWKTPASTRPRPPGRA